MTWRVSVSAKRDARSVFICIDACSLVTSPLCGPSLASFPWGDWHRNNTGLCPVFWLILPWSHQLIPSSRALHALCASQEISRHVWNPTAWRLPASQSFPYTRFFFIYLYCALFNACISLVFSDQHVCMCVSSLLCVLHALPIPLSVILSP